jgi:hypothetical protein
MFGRRQKKFSKTGQAAVAAKIKQNLLGQQRRKPVSSIKKIDGFVFLEKTKLLVAVCEKAEFLTYSHADSVLMIDCFFVCGAIFHRTYYFLFVFSI